MRELGAKVDSGHQEIRVDGQPLKKVKRVYFLVNKPIGVVSTNFDPSGRPRVIDLFPNIKERLFTVGRLDLSSEGLMLVTNDGQLANELAHPRYGVEKTYHVLVAGQPAPEVLRQLRHGIHLAEGVAHVVSVKVKSALKQSTLLELVLNEGRNREIRRLLAKVGHKVLKLKRVALGGVRLKDLPPGEFRRLRSDELKKLRERSRPARRPRSAGSPETAGDSAKPEPSKVARSAREGGERLRGKDKPAAWQRIPDDVFARRRRPAPQSRHERAPLAGTPTVSEAKSPHAATFADRAWFGSVSVSENVQLARDTYRLRFDCPQIAERITPGQFVMLRLAGYDDPLLGRPLALYDTVLDDSGRPVGSRCRVPGGGQTDPQAGEPHERPDAGSLGAAGQRLSPAVHRAFDHGGGRHWPDPVRRFGPGIPGPSLLRDAAARSSAKRRRSRSATGPAVAIIWPA